MAGGGSTFVNIEEYVDAADAVLNTLCPHVLKEIVATVALVNPGLFAYALDVASNGCDPA